MFIFWPLVIVLLFVPGVIAATISYLSLRRSRSLGRLLVAYVVGPLLGVGSILLMVYTLPAMTGLRILAEFTLLFSPIVSIGAARWAAPKWPSLKR